MDDSGWKLVKSNNQSFLVRRSFSEENFKIQVTDHKRLWSAEGTAKDLLLMSQKKNPLCEFSLSKVTHNIFNVFDKSLDLLRVDGDDVTFKTLTISTSLGNRPFNLVWNLSEQGPDALFEEVTGPLLSFAQEMSQRQYYLCQEIREKDMEISEHLAENGPLKWGKIKTERFNRDEFMGMFSYHNTPDLIASAWETYDEALPIFNKNVLGRKKKREDLVEISNPNQNEVAVKQEEIIPENNPVVEPAVEVPKNNSVVEPAVEVPVKQEKVVEPPVSTATQSKRKKVKLNL